MPAPEAERLATIEEQLRGLRDDVAAMSTEQIRSRGRLHDLEGTTAALVLDGQERRRREAIRDKELNLRIQILTLVVAIAAVVTPLVVGGIHP